MRAGGCRCPCCGIAGIFVRTLRHAIKNNLPYKSDCDFKNLPTEGNCNDDVPSNIPMGTISGKVTEIDKKKTSNRNAESLDVAGAGGETRTRKGMKPGGF